MDEQDESSSKLSCFLASVNLCHLSPAEKCVLKIYIFETGSFFEVKVLNRIFPSSMHAKRPKKEQNERKREVFIHLRHFSE